MSERRPWDRIPIASSGAPAVAGVLTKSSRRIPPICAAEPERLLDSPTYEGFPIRPLYTSLDAQPEPPLPGQWPFIRGGDATARRQVRLEGGRGRSRRRGRRGRRGQRCGAARADRRRQRAGAAGRRRRRGRSETSTGCSRACSSTWCRSCSTRARDFAAAADAVLALVTDLDDEQRSRLSVDLGADPLTAPLSGRVPRRRPTRSSPRQPRLAGYGGGVRAITVDGPAFHDLGANASWELAGAIAAGVGYLRLLVDGGVAAPDALRQISFRFAADDDQFMTIAKLRAARQLWARVAEVVGRAGRRRRDRARGHLAADDGPARSVGEHAAHHAGGLRGRRRGRRHRAGSPVRRAIPGGWPGTAASFARRIARNTQLLLLEESHIGRVLDPGGGSWFVEDLTERWPNRRGRTSRTSRPAAASRPPATTSPTRSRRWPTAAPTTSRTGAPRSPGSTSIPNLAEAPLPQTDSTGRCGAVRGRLRGAAGPLRCLPRQARASGRQALLLPLGPLAEHNIRTTFAANLLASGGIEAVNPGPSTPRQSPSGSDAGGADVAVICGTDARYATEASDVVEAARAAGVSHILLAGPEKAVGGRAERSPTSI